MGKVNGIILMPCEVTASSPYTPKEWKKIEKMASEKGEVFPDENSAKKILRAMREMVQLKGEGPLGRNHSGSHRNRFGDFVCFEGYFDSLCRSKYSRNPSFSLLFCFSDK